MCIDELEDWRKSQTVSTQLDKLIEKTLQGYGGIVMNQESLSAFASQVREQSIAECEQIARKYQHNMAVHEEWSLAEQSRQIAAEIKSLAAPPQTTEQEER